MLLQKEDLCMYLRMIFFNCDEVIFKAKKSHKGEKVSLDKSSLRLIVPSDMLSVFSFFFVFFSPNDVWNLQKGSETHEDYKMSSHLVKKEA